MSEIKSKLSAFKLSCQNCSLATLCLPLGLEPTDLSRLDNIIEQKKPLNRREHLYRAGDHFSGIFAIRSGSFKTYTINDEGEEQIQGFYLPGEIIGLDAIAHDRHMCSSIALETSSVCEIPFAEIEKLSASIPSLQHQMFRLMSQEILKEEQQLLVLGKMSAEERLATLLLSLSERFHARGFSAVDFNLSMSRHEIANYLGLAVETVSRLFRRFQDEGVLTVERKHIKINQLDSIKAKVSLCEGHSTIHSIA